MIHNPILEKRSVIDKRFSDIFKDYSKILSLNCLDSDEIEDKLQKKHAIIAYHLNEEGDITNLIIIPYKDNGFIKTEEGYFFVCQDTCIIILLSYYILKYGISKEITYTIVEQDFKTFELTKFDNIKILDNMDIHYLKLLNKFVFSNSKQITSYIDNIKNII